MLSTASLSDPSCSSKVSGLRADERNSEQLSLRESDPVGFGEAKTPNFSIRGYVFASRNKNIGTSWPFPCQLLQLCLKHEIRDPLPPFEQPSSVRACFRRRPVGETEEISDNSPRVSEFGDQLDENPSEDVVLKCWDKTEGRQSSEEDKPEYLISDECEIGSTLTNHSDVEKIPARLVEPVVKCKLIQRAGVISETSGAEEVASTSMASDFMASKVCPVCKAFSSTSNTTLNAHMDQCLSLESNTTLAVDKIPKLKVKPRKKRLMEDIYGTARLCSLEDLDRRNGTTWAKDLTFVAPITEANIEANAEAKRLKLSQIDNGGEKSEGAVYVDSNGIKLRILSKFNDAPKVILGEEFRFQNTTKGAGDEKLMLITKKKNSAAKCSKKMKFKLKNKKLSSLKLFKNEAAPQVPHDDESQQVQGSSVQLAGDQEQAATSCGSATLRRWPCSKRSDLPRKVSKSGFHKSLEHQKMVTQLSMLETRTSASAISCAAKNHLVKFSQSPESQVANLPANTHQHEENQQKISEGWSSKSASTNVLLLKLSRASGALESSPRSRKEELCLKIKHRLDDSPEAYRRPADNCHFPLKTKRVSTLSKLNSSTKKLRKQCSLVLTDKRKVFVSSNSKLKPQRSETAAVMGLPLEEVTDQSLHPGSSQCRDIVPRNSEMQVQNLGLITPTEASLEKADCSLIIAKSVNDDDKGIMLDANDKTRAIMPMEECAMPMEQEFADKQIKQTAHKLKHGEVESQAEVTSAQESSACLSSHGGGNTSITSACPPKEMNLAISRKSSESPASSASISPSSPNDSHSRASDRKSVSKHSTTQVKLCLPLPYMEQNQQAQINYVKKPQQLPECQPCCCSWRSVIAGTMPTSISKPYINPSNPIFDSYSSLWTANTTFVESPTESILTRTCSDVGSTSPSCETPKQYSNSILRLMGKNLMVMHNEESTQLPKVHSPASDNTSVQGLPSLFGYKTSYAVPSPAPSMTNMQFNHCLPSIQQSNMNHSACATKEVIVIDGSSGDNIMLRGTLSSVPPSQNMFQRPVACFPLQNQLLPGNNRLRFSCPIKKGNSLEVSDPLL